MDKRMCNGKMYKEEEKMEEKMAGRRKYGPGYGDMEEEEEKTMGEGRKDGRRGGGWRPGIYQEGPSTGGG
jgi:hypothetical protein